MPGEMKEPAGEEVEQRERRSRMPVGQHGLERKQPRHKTGSEQDGKTTTQEEAANGTAKTGERTGRI